MTRDQPLDVIGVGALAEQEHDAAALSRIQDDLHLQRGAGIEPGAELRLERQVAQGGRPGSEPLRPMNERRWPVAERGVSLACANATRRANSSL